MGCNEMMTRIELHFYLACVCERVTWNIFILLTFLGCSLLMILPRVCRHLAEYVFFCVTCVASSGWVESNDFASCAPQNSSRRLKRFALLTTAQRGCLKCPKRGAEHGMADDWSQHGCHDMGKLYWLSAQDNLSVTCLTSRFKLKIHISCLHSIQTILELFKHQANIKCKTKTPEILWCHPFPLQIHKHLASPKLTRLLYHHGVTACSKAAAVSQLQTPSPMGRALLSCPIQNCPARKKSWNRALWWFDEGRAMT